MQPHEFPAELDPQAFNLIILALVYGIPVVLAIAGLVIGSILESRHFRSIRERESRFTAFPAVPTRSWDAEREVIDAQLVATSVVVSLDYFKRILAALRNIFGGRVRSYETLLDRARREAILRLKESVPEHHIIVNLRLDTSNISSIHGRKAKGVAGVEVLASGTAIRYGS
jgi:uncharacterized protein YbjQ (UPF0145 family)